MTMNLQTKTQKHCGVKRRKSNALPALLRKWLYSSALQHHKREKVEAELKEMAANWSEEMKRYDAEKEKSKPT